MGRPVTTGTTKTKKITLAVTPEVRKYLEVISQEKQISISQMLSDYATKEYKKLQQKLQK